ncbi:MAG: amidohydrolase family protein [Actinomycetota bacterium]
MTAAVLRGGLVVRSPGGAVEATDLVVSEGRIGGSASEGEPVDVSGCLVVPGHACAHHHLYSTLARGMPAPGDPPRSFLEILERVWWRLDRALDLESAHLSALAGAVAAVRCGTTSLVDHHASPQAIDSSLDAVAEGIDGSGARAVVCYEVSDRHGVERGRAGIEENVRFLAENRRERVRAMMGAHASFTLGARTLESLVDSARAAGAPIHIHLAEDDHDERDSVTKHGVRAAQRLRRAGALARGDLVAHGVCLDAAEVSLLQSSGAWLAHNARSNMNNGVGYAPVAMMLERVALGTDGIDGDMFAEARASYFRAREANLSATPQTTLERLAGGAAFVGALFGEPLLGSLLEGAPADLAVLEYDSPTPVDAGNLAGHYVFGLTTAAVRDVMVAGRWIVRDRRHQLVDEEELAARCRRAAPELWDRMQSL